MFFQGSSSVQPQRPLPQRETPALEAQEEYFFVDFGAVFAEEMEKVLRLRRQGMLCEVVFWQDLGYF